MKHHLKTSTQSIELTIPNTRLNRRRFLVGSTVVAATLSAPSAFAQSQTSDLNQSIAQIVTGKQIDSFIANRAVSAITSKDENYPSALQTLAKFISDNNIKDVEALKNAPGFNAPLKATAMSLISALYLGYVGTPKAMTAEDGVEFVTYTQALTYRLTSNVIPIPSFSQWKTNYWNYLPKSI